MDTIKVFITSRETGDRLAEKEPINFEEASGGKDDVKSGVTITVEPDKMYQTLLGFGGAFTEAAALTLSKMSEDKRAEVIKAYFDQEEGLGYCLGRVAIHSCDFSLGNYTYVEEEDETLESFDIKRDRRHIIPLIQDAVKAREESIAIIATPWSPPAWMKDNKMMNGGGKLLPRYYDTWAKYYCKFIKTYQEAGIPIWGISVQNEPDAVQKWDSCIYSKEEERDFIKNHLGPQLHEEQLQDVKLLIWDHNRDHIAERAEGVLGDPEASKYVWGTAFHWYVSEAFENVGKVHEMFPDKHLIFTEGCQEGGSHPGEWHTGERYARNIIGDMNNFSEGFIDWNLCLDEIGGPNHVGNFCDAPILCDTKNNELIYNSSYYYIGHFSKFMKPGSRRIETQVNTKKLKVLACRDEEGIVIVVLNENDEAQEYSVKVGSKRYNHSIERHSVITYLL